MRRCGLESAGIDRGLQYDGENGENGFMAPEDREAFAEVTRKVLEDEVLRKRLKDGAKESAKKY